VVQRRVRNTYRFFASQDRPVRVRFTLDRSAHVELKWLHMETGHATLCPRYSFNFSYSSQLSGHLAAHHPVALFIPHETGPATAASAPPPSRLPVFPPRRVPSPGSRAYASRHRRPRLSGQDAQSPAKPSLLLLLQATPISGASGSIPSLHPGGMPAHHLTL
jgi:hypothetical protein